MRKIIFIGTLFLCIHTSISFGDLVGFVTYKFENDIYFVSAEDTNNSSILSSFVDEFIRQQVENGNMVEISKFSCSSGDIDCYNQGNEAIKGRKNLVDSILLNHKKKLLKIASLAYAKYFLTFFLTVFLIVLTLKKVFFGNNKNIYLTFFALSICTLFFDGLLFYIGMHPVFFELGFLIFPYIIYTGLFVLIYVLLDLLATKKFKNNHLPTNQTIPDENHLGRL